MDDEGSGRLVLISPFTSMTAMVQRIARVFPRRLVPDRWETTELAHRIADLVPPRMSEELAARIPAAHRVVIDGRTHNDLWEPPSGCLEAVADFASD